MADICIIADQITVNEDGSVLTVHGNARIEGYAESVAWETTISWTATQAGVNSAITTAAIAAAETASGLTVGALDNKMLLGGAVGL